MNEEINKFNDEIKEIHVSYTIENDKIYVSVDGLDDISLKKEYMSRYKDLLKTAKHNYKIADTDDCKIEIIKE